MARWTLLVCVWALCMASVCRATNTKAQDNQPVWATQDLLREDLVETTDGYYCTAVRIDAERALTAARCIRQVDQNVGLVHIAGTEGRLLKIDRELDIALVSAPTERRIYKARIRRPRNSEGVFTNIGVGEWRGDISLGRVTRFVPLTTLETDTFIVGGKSGSGIWSSFDGSLVGIVIRCQKSAYSVKKKGCVAGYGNIAVPGDAILRFLGEE